MKVFQLKAKETLLANLRSIMEQKNLRYEDLGKLMGVKKQRISALFNQDSGITLNTVENIAKALKVKETDLFNPDLFKKKK